jgi:spore coat protein U-like protein
VAIFGYIASPQLSLGQRFLSAIKANIIENCRRLTFASAAIGAFGMGLSGGPAAAATTTATFSVTATVLASCTVAATPLPFGSYTGAVLNVTSTVTATCTTTTPYTVGLNAGTSGGTVTTRQMTGALATLLPYSLSVDSAHTVNWGNTAGSFVAGVGTGAAQPLTVYGQIAASVFATPGAYTDTITATLTY